MMSEGAWSEELGVALTDALLELAAAEKERTMAGEMLAASIQEGARDRALAWMRRLSLAVARARRANDRAVEVRRRMALGPEHRREDN